MTYGSEVLQLSNERNENKLKGLYSNGIGKCKNTETQAKTLFPIYIDDLAEELEM